jgi:WD40 repeat protein
MSTSWQTVSVFISSTFNDMHAERDYLVKRVFPELREWCEKRKLRLVDIDLRWGVTEDDATRHKNVVKVCLDRIDECRPFFLCFLGQRRGWVPEKSDVSKETCETYKDLKKHLGNASVTELEILHATINPLNDKDRAKYSFFYLRDDSYLKDLPDNPPLIRKTYTNEGICDQNERDIADKELTTWRNEKIPSTTRPVHHYSATWNEKAKTPELNIPLHCPSSNPENQKQWRNLWKTEAGIDVPDLDIEKNPELAERAKTFNNTMSRGRLGDFTSEGKQLSKIILDDLKKAIEERYPDHQKISEESDLQKELDQQEQFLNLNSEGFIERSGDFDHLDMHVEGDSRNLFVLTATGGMGKTMLLANWIVHYQNKQGAKNTALLYRFIGASDQSTTVNSVMRYLLREMKDNAMFFDDEIPADPEKLRNAWPELLSTVGSRKKTIIIIDAVNQLESGLSDLRWIPWQMPSGIKMIISFKREGDDAEKLYKQFAGSEVITLAEVKPFTNEEDQKALINAYFHQYLKELDDAQIAELIASPGATNPLFLKIVLSELRVFGAFTNLGKKIRDDFGTTPVSAFGAVLNRLENDPSYSPVESKIAVPLLFGLLSHAHHGLSEEELISLFLQELKWENSLETREELKDTIRLLLRQVRSFLGMREGRYDFFYESFNLSAIDRYEGIDKGRYQRLSTEWHKSLADYFEQLPSWLSEENNFPTIRKAAELPYHLVWAGQSDHLADLIFAYELLEMIVFGLGPYSVIEDISLAISSQDIPDNKIIENRVIALNLIRDSIRLSAHILNNNPAELPTQVFGRLISSDELLIRTFLNQIMKRQTRPWIRLLTNSLIPPTGALIRTFKVTGLISVVALTPDGRYIVVGSMLPPLKTLDFATGECAQIFFGHKGGVKDVTITQDSQFIISGSTDKTLKVWNLETGICVKTFEGHTGIVTAVALTPDSQFIISGSMDKSLKVWNLETGICVKTFEGHTGIVTAVALTSDSQYIISGSWDSTLKVWNLETGFCIKTLKGHTNTVTTLALTPDSQYIISGSTDKTLKVWNLETGFCVQTLKGHTSTITAVQTTPDGQLIVSASLDKTIRVWNLEKGECTKTLQGHSWMVEDIAISKDSRLAISAHGGSSLLVWNLEANTFIQTHKRHTNSVESVIMTPNCRFGISCGDKILNVWNLETGVCTKILEGHTGLVEDVTVTPDSQFVISGSTDKTLKVWNLETGLCVKTLKGHKNTVTTVQLTPDGQSIVSASLDSTLKVWNLATGQCVHTLQGRTDFIKLREISCLHRSAMKVTSDGMFVIIGGAYQLEVWNLATGVCLQTLQWHLEAITAVDVTPDNHYAISASLDSTIKVWDLATGACVNTLYGHTKDIYSIAVTPDGKHLVSGSRDATLKVWNLATGVCVHTLYGHTSWIMAVIVTPDNHYAVSSSLDSTIKIWDLTTGTQITTIHVDDSCNSCRLSYPFTVIAGENSGRVNIFQIENIQPDLPITTAMECEDGSILLHCFFCQQWSDLQKVNLGTEIACPLCGDKMQLNSFTYREHPIK